MSARDTGGLAAPAAGGPPAETAAPAELPIEALEWFAELSDAIRSADSVGRAIESALPAIVDHLGFSRGLCLIAGRRNDFSVAVAVGEYAATVDRHFTLVDAGATKEVYDATESDEPFIDRISHVLAAYPSRLVVPLARGGRLFGVLLLGRVEDAAPQQRPLIVTRLIAAVLAYVLESRASQRELKRANELLNARTYQLQTLVEVGRELSLAPDVDSLYRVLCETARGHAGTHVSGVLERREDRFVIVAVEGFEPTAEEADRVSSRSFFRRLSAIERAVPLDELEGAEGHAALARWGASFLVPMRHRERVRGILAVGSRGGERLSPFELDFLVALGAQASIARENLRLRDEALVRQRLEREAAIARDIQRSLLPGAPPSIPGYEVAARMRTCYEVGGDYYDFIDAGPGLVGIALGDVPGNGTPAALFMATVQATVRALASGAGLRPAELLGEVNHLVTQATRGDNFVTFLYALLDSNSHRLTAANAGHCHPLVIRRDGRVESIGVSDLVLGLVRDVRYAEYSAELEEGDLVVLYTDGLGEGQNSSGELFGEGEMHQVLATRAGSTAREVVDALFAGLDRFTGGGPLRDDTTVVVLRRLMENPTNSR